MRAIFAFTSFHEVAGLDGFEILSQISEQEAKRGLGIYPQLNVIMTGEACHYHY